MLNRARFTELSVQRAFFFQRHLDREEKGTMKQEIENWVERTAHAIGSSMKEMNGFLLLFWRQNKGRDNDFNIWSAAELARLRQNDFFRFVRVNRNGVTFYYNAQMCSKQDRLVGGHVGWIGTEQNQAIWAGGMAHRLKITASEMYDLLLLYHEAIAGKPDVDLAVTAQTAMDNEESFMQFAEEWISAC
jgi:hypothetical protein